MRREPTHGMHPGFTIPGFESVAHFFANGSDHHRTALHVKSPHSANVTRQVTFDDEFRKSCLLDEGRPTTKDPSGGEKSLDQIFGYDQIPDPKRSKKNFAESAYVDDTTGAI